MKIAAYEPLYQVDGNIYINHKAFLQFYLKIKTEITFMFVSIFLGVF